MRPSPSSTRLAVPAFPDLYGPSYVAAPWGTLEHSLLKVG
jgi:hypothetical protein